MAEHLQYWAPLESAACQWQWALTVAHCTPPNACHAAGVHSMGSGARQITE